jgi:hypothetical protein
MARRRRRNPTKNDVLPIVIGAIGGGMAIYLYMKSQTSPTAGTQTVSVTTPTLPTVSTQPTA